MHMQHVLCCPCCSTLLLHQAKKKLDELGPIPDYTAEIKQITQQQNELRDQVRAVVARCPTASSTCLPPSRPVAGLALTANQQLSNGCSHMPCQAVSGRSAVPAHHCVVLSVPLLAGPEPGE